MADRPESDFRTVRGYQLLNSAAGRLTPALEDYLEMTYRLCLRNGYARVGRLSELLNVKPPSVSRMISKLAHLGYLKTDRYDVIGLTVLGRETGAYLLRRHEAVEHFMKLIGSVNPLEETELIEHSLSPSTVADLIVCWNSSMPAPTCGTLSRRLRLRPALIQTNRNRGL
jgi:Mn-dependent DtxR family transcriptional regulator